MLEKIKKIIIIVGCQRSGTTLISLILGAPKNTVLLDESDGVYSWFDMYIKKQPEAIKTLSGVFYNARKKYKDASERFFLDKDNNFYLSSQVEYLVLKSPNLTYKYDDFEKLNIPFCVVYAVRDPRAVVASMLELTHVDIGSQLQLLKNSSSLSSEFKAETAILTNGDQQSYINFALLWKIKSSLFPRYVDRGLTTYLCKYEHLFDDTKVICKEMTDRLSIPFSETMLSHHSFYHGVAQGKTNRNRAIDGASISKWNTKLSEQQALDVVSISQNTMELLGYLDKDALPKTGNSSVFCVLGMHRSGTSCLTGCLQEYGLYLGDVVDKAPHNLKGNKESRILWDINDHVLEFNGGAWDNPPEDLLWNDALRSNRDIFISIYSAHSQWGFKDPRVTLVLPFWLEALPNMNFVGTFRNPMDVAQSLVKRNSDKFTIEKGLQLWKSYNLKLLEYSKRYDFPLVCFDWPAEKYLHAVKKLAQHSDLTQSFGEGSLSFFEKNLRHHSCENIDKSIPEAILQIYTELLSKAEKILDSD